MRQIICIILFSVATLNIFAQNCLDDLDILLQQDFEDNATGAYTTATWQGDWITPVCTTEYSQGRTRVSIVSDANHIQNPSKTLQMSFPANSLGPSEGGDNWEVTFKNNKKEELYVSYDIMFMPGFQFQKGGKIPSVSGGYVKSNTKADGYNGFTGGLMFKEDGKVVFYPYLVDSKNNGGDTYYWGRTYSDGQFSPSQVKFKDGHGEVAFIPGNWHNLTYRIVLNTVPSEGNGSFDGILEGFLDGKLIIQAYNMQFRKTKSLAIDRIRIYSFFGGDTPDWANPIAEWVRFDNFMLYTFKSGINVPRGNTLSPTTRTINYWRNFMQESASICGAYNSGYNNSANPLKATTITSCSSGATIKSGATLVAQANNQIVLNPGFIADAGSKFTAEIVASNCSTISKSAEENKEGIFSEPVSESATGDIKIFPNPNSGQFAIEVTSDDDAEVFVFNNLGQQISNSKFKNQAQIDLSNQPAGMYFVTVKLNDKTYNEKIIVR